MAALSQEDLILRSLKMAGRAGLHPTYFIETLHIFQYNARINGLRSKFGCSCKNGRKYCGAREHIINFELSNGTTVFEYRNYKAEVAGISLASYMREDQEKRNATPTQVSLL